MSFAQLPDRLVTRIAAFSLVGLINTAVGVAVIVVAGLLGASPILANVLGYGLGLGVSFTLNSRVTFRGRTADAHTVVRFLGAFAIAFAANLAIVKVITGVYSAHRVLGSLAGTPIYVAIFYLLCEFWVFQHLNPRPAKRTSHQ